MTGLILLHTLTVELAEDRKVAGAVHWVKRGHYHHMSEFVVPYGARIEHVEKLLWQPLYSNGPDMRFHAQPLDEHSCLVRLEARNIAWPHVKFNLHLLGSAPSNAGPIAALLEENESLRRDLQAVTASFFRLHKKVESLQAAFEERELNEAAREREQASHLQCG